MVVKGDTNNLALKYATLRPNTTTCFKKIIKISAIWFLIHNTMKSYFEMLKYKHMSHQNMDQFSVARRQSALAAEFYRYFFSIYSGWKFLTP